MKHPKAGSGTRTVVFAALVVVIVAAVTAVLIYRTRTAPFRSTILTVNDQSITMHYFLKRLHWSRGSPTEMLRTLTNEEIIKQIAPFPPYSIKITQDDVDLFLREIARRNGAAGGEDNFKAWFRQQLDETRLSDAEYRDLFLVNMLSQRLIRYLEDRVPTVAEQVHIYMVVRGSAADAQRVKERLDAGDDFFALARELNIDEELKNRDGELGWFPRAALSDSIAHVAFDTLEIGQASEPLDLTDSLFAIILVSERVAAAQIEEEALETMKANALERWLAQEIRRHNVVVRGLSNGYDTETDAWVEWQLTKMRKKREIER